MINGEGFRLSNEMSLVPPERSKIISLPRAFHGTLCELRELKESVKLLLLLKLLPEEEPNCFKISFYNRVRKNRICL